jgi:NAD(P)-dependent dehydrogenase (short-subunit alcohol dehydrogenase family)
VLLTGASTGIGLAAAEAMAQAGWRVYAGYRKDTDGQTLQKLHANIRPIRLDITSDADIQAAVSQLEGELGNRGLDCLFNNAGIAVAAPLEALPIDKFRQQLEVNVTAQLAVTQAFIPLIRQAKGRIMITGSISGRLAMPMTGAYSCSKFAIEAMADALRRELFPWGIHVVLLEPGQIRTPIWEKSLGAALELKEKFDPQKIAMYQDAIDQGEQMAKTAAKSAAPVSVATRVILKALYAPKPRARYTIGRDAFIAVRIARWLPDSAKDWLIRRRLRERI